MMAMNSLVSNKLAKPTILDATIQNIVATVDFERRIDLEYARANCWINAYPERKDVKVRFHELRSYKIARAKNIYVRFVRVSRFSNKQIALCQVLSSFVLSFLFTLDLLIH